MISVVVARDLLCAFEPCAAHCGSRPSRAIAKKMRGWPYWNTSSTADIETTAPSATIQPTVVEPGELERARQRIGDRQLLVRHHPGQHERRR